MTEYICTCNEICVEQKYEQPFKPQSISVWNALRNLAEIIGEVYRFNNELQPNFSNGSARVIIRPDRIDLA